MNEDEKSPYAVKISHIPDLYKLLVHEKQSTCLETFIRELLAIKPRKCLRL